MAVEKRRTSAASKPKPKSSLPIAHVADHRVSHKKVLIAGKSHTGKTYLAAQFPNTLWFDSDHNLETVKNMGLNPPVVVLHTEEFRNGNMGYLELRKILNQLIDQEGEWHDYCTDNGIETLVFDSLSSLSYQFEEELLENHPNKNRKEAMAERLSLPDYNLILGRMKGVIELLTSSTMPYNVVGTCHVELAVADITEAIEEQPLMTGKALGRVVPGLFGDIFLTGYDTKEKKFYATNEPTKRFQYAGNRGGSKTGVFYNPTYKDIYG